MSALVEAPAQPPEDDVPELLANFLRTSSVADGGAFDGGGDGGAFMPPPRGQRYVLAVLQELYPEAASDPAVVRLVADHPETLAVLLELPRAATAAFGRRTEVTLERFRDRESVGDEQLVANLDVPRPRAERRRLLREFDRSWWLARTRHVGAWMFLDAR